MSENKKDIKIKDDKKKEIESSAKLTIDDFNDLDFDMKQEDYTIEERLKMSKEQKEEIKVKDKKKVDNIEEKKDNISMNDVASEANTVLNPTIKPEGVNGVKLDNIQPNNNNVLNTFSNSKDDYNINYNTSNNYNYTYNELKSYLETNKDRLMSNRCKEAAEELKKREDKIKKVREACDKKIKEKREKISKRINKLANQKGPDGRRNIDNPDFLANIVNKDPEIIRYRQKIDTIKHTKESFIKEQQNKFLEWEKRNSKGVNIIVRNNNYLLVKGLTARVSSGELDSKENSAPTYKGTNMVQFANALTHLLSNKIENEKDEEKKNSLQVVMTKLLNTIKTLLGQSAEKKEIREKNENNLSNILTEIVSNLFGKNENKVKNEIQNIQERETQNINNYNEISNFNIIKNKVFELASEAMEKVLGINVTKLETYKKYHENLTKPSYLEQEHSISKGQNNSKDLSYERAMSQLTSKNNINENKLITKKETYYGDSVSEDGIIKTAIKDKDKNSEYEIELNSRDTDSVLSNITVSESDAIAVPAISSGTTKSNDISGASIV